MSPLASRSTVIAAVLTLALACAPDEPLPSPAVGDPAAVTAAVQPPAEAPGAPGSSPPPPVVTRAAPPSYWVAVSAREGTATDLPRQWLFHDESGELCVVVSMRDLRTELQLREARESAALLSALLSLVASASAGAAVPQLAPVAVVLSAGSGAFAIGAAHARDDQTDALDSVDHLLHQTASILPSALQGDCAMWSPHFLRWLWRPCAPGVLRRGQYQALAEAARAAGDLCSDLSGE
jgi:hypothetical protein